MGACGAGEAVVTIEKDSVVVEANGASVTVPMERLTFEGLEHLPTATAAPAGASGTSRASRATPTPRPVSTPTPRPTATPTAAPAADTGDWTTFDYDGSEAAWRSIQLEAYETGYRDGDATLSVACFDAKDGGARYLSVSVHWDTYHGLHGNDISTHLTWGEDTGSKQYEDWVGSDDGDSVSPRYSRTQRHDKAFIALLGRFDHLEITANGLLGWPDGKFNLNGFEAAYEPVKEYCAT